MIMNLYSWYSKQIFEFLLNNKLHLWTMCESMFDNWIVLSNNLLYLNIFSLSSHSLDISRPQNAISRRMHNNTTSTTLNIQGVKKLMSSLYFVLQCTHSEYYSSLSTILTSILETIMLCYISGRYLSYLIFFKILWHFIRITSHLANNMVREASLATRNQAMGMLKAGLTQQKVVTHFGITVRTVRRWWSRVQSGHSLENMGGRGRKSALGSVKNYYFKNTWKKAKVHSQNLPSIEIKRFSSLSCNSL